MLLFRVTRSSGHKLNKTLENATLNHRPTTDNHSLTFTPKGNECNLHVLSIVKRYDTTSPCDSQGIHETNKNIFQQEKALFENTLFYFSYYESSHLIQSSSCDLMIQLHCIRLVAEDLAFF